MQIGMIELATRIVGKSQGYPYSNLKSLSAISWTP